MKIYEVSEYIAGRGHDVSSTDLKVREQGQKITVLDPNKEYPLEFLKEFLGIDAGENIIKHKKDYYESFNGSDIIEFGIDYGVLKREAVVIEDFSGFKKGSTIYFNYVPVCYSDDELNIFPNKTYYDESEGTSCWSNYVDRFIMKPGPTLEEIVNETIRDNVSDFPDTRNRDKLKEHYLCVRSYLIRGLKLANANNILLDLEWFEKQLEEIKPLIDLTRDWLLLFVDPDSVITCSEAFSILTKEGGSVRDEEGKVYTKDDIHSIKYDILYERNK